MRRASSSKRSRRPPPPPPTSKFAARLRSSSGMEQRKKIKFADLDGGSKDLATNGTKTSEFLYFKKLWGNARNKQIAQTSNAVAPKSDKRGVLFPVPIEKENCIDCTKIISRPNTSLDHNEQLNEEEPTCSGINDTPTQYLNGNERLFSLCKITPLDQRPLFLSPEASKSSDKRFENGGVFSEKRHKLIKLVSKTLGVGIDEFSSRRSDLIGEVLLRLGIKHRSDLKGSISSSFKEMPCDKYLQISSSNSHENLNFGDEIRLKSSDLNANNLPTLPSSPYCDLVPHNYSFHDQVGEQSLVPYGCGNSSSYSDLHRFQSPVKQQCSSEVETEFHLPLAFCKYSSDFYDENENFGDFNGCINEEMLFDLRRQHYALEWKSSTVCESKDSFSQLSDIDFANERSHVLLKEDTTNGVFGFDSNIQELGSWFSVDGYGSSWHSHPRDGFDFDFFD